MKHTVHTRRARSSPDVLLDADLLGDGQRQDEEEAEEHQGEALVRIEVVWHLRLWQPSQHLVQGTAHWHQSKYRIFQTISPSGV